MGKSFEYRPGDNEMSDTFLENAHAKAKDVIEMNRVDIDDFEGFYPDNKLAADKEYVASRKAMMEVPHPNLIAEQMKRHDKAKRTSDVMEAMIIDPKVIRSWYAYTDKDGNKISEVNAMGTSELDDLANGVDAVWELKHVTEGYSNLALAVDVTFSSSFEEKIQYIKGNIDQGQLAKVEYFMPKWGDMKGEVTQIPRVVIGADAKHLTDLALLWSRIDDRRPEVEVNPMQLLVLEEILLQLPIYEQYALSIGQDVVVDKIRTTRLKFEKLHEQTLKKLPGASDYIEEDKVFTNLKQYLKDFDSMPTKVSNGKFRQDINAKHGVKE